MTEGNIDQAVADRIVPIGHARDCLGMGREQFLGDDTLKAAEISPVAELVDVDSRGAHADQLQIGLESLITKEVS